MTYKIKPMHCEADYEAALAAVSPLFDTSGALAG
jgi:HTH-type transcriptional regulator/antitoxin HigA